MRREPERDNHLPQSLTMIDESGLVVYHSSLDRRAGKDDTLDCSAEAIGNRKRLQCAPPSRER